MDTGEFGTEQVKKEVVYNDFNEEFPTDTVKQEPSEINILSKCGMYDESWSETDFVDKPEYIDHSEICKDISTDECKKEQIKCDNDLGIFYKDIKCEVGEENLGELDKFCEVCNNSISSETGFIDSKNNKLECSCQEQNDSINLQSKVMTLDTSDSGLQRLIVEGKTVSEDEYNNIHERIHTGEKQFHCKVCPKSFSLLKNLRNHKKNHAGEKPYHCKVCSKSFCHLGRLNNHMNVHTGEKLFRCKICPRSFILSKYLKNHESIHAEEKSFHCKVCSKSFYQSRSLNFHLKEHTGEKTYCCNVCSKSFFYSKNLNDHMKIHTEEKPFQCKICSKYFDGESYFNTHLKMHTEFQL